MRKFETRTRRVAGVVVIASVCHSSVIAQTAEPGVPPTPSIDRAEPDVAKIAEQFVEFAAERIRDGRTEAGVAQIESRMAELDREFGAVSAYKSAKVTVLSWLDRDEEADALFNSIPDADLSSPSDLQRRLGQRVRDPDAVVLLGSRLADADPARFAKWVHQSFSQPFAPPRFSEARDRSAVAEVQRPSLRALAACDSPAARSIVRPLDLWDRAEQLGTADAARELASIDPDATTYADRYAILGVWLLAHLGEEKEAAARLTSIVNQFKARPEITTASPVAAEQAPRARSRALIARSEVLLAELDPSDRLEHLRAAAEFSPDSFDARSAATYFYEQVALASESHDAPLYAAALAEAGQTEQAAEVLATLAIDRPDLADTARSVYDETVGDDAFDRHVRVARESRLPSLPDLPYLELDRTPSSLAAFHGRWLLIDFWGVWCGPCVSEMPKLNAFAARVQREAGDRAAVLALSYRDTPEAIEKFLDSRGLDLPVGCATPELLEAFGVVQFPTKVLVTPSGRWTAIQAQADWEGIASEAIFSSDDPTPSG